MDPKINRSSPRYIPIARPMLGRDEQKAASDAIESGWISSGKLVERFEEEFAGAHGKKYGVACNSGTTALHLALAARDANYSRRVYVPTMMMVACANAIRYCDTTPIFIDSEPHTGNGNFRDLRDYHAAPPLVICSHLYGMPSGRPNFSPFDIIEDCAEAHYATFPDGRPVGSYGDLATFSFYANKIITTGEGGMVITNSPDLAEKMRGLRAHAFDPVEHFNHQSLAFGYRMTDVQAAIGLVQHRHHDGFLSWRRELYDRYCQRLADVSWLTWPRKPEGSVDWLFPAQIIPQTWEGAPRNEIEIDGTKAATVARDTVRYYLAECGIETRTWFKPLHQQKHLRDYATGSYPVADRLFDNGVCLPIFNGMKLDEVDYVCEAVKQAGKQIEAANKTVAQSPA